MTMKSFTDIQLPDMTDAYRQVQEKAKKLDPVGKEDGDVDNDGDKDIVGVAEGSNTVYWFENNCDGNDPLIFDLDGDHLPGVSDADFPSMISLIQDQAWSFWNDFLEPEFNLKREFAQFTFSGHRGFHIHVRDPSLMGLDSNARREIVSYIRGEGLEVNTILSGNASGWRDRIDIGTQSVLDLSLIHI